MQCTDSRACIVQHTCRRLLLPADQDFRGDDRAARAVAAAPWQAAIGREDRASPGYVIGRIHRNWPAVEIMVRGDSHFATPEVMDLLEQKRCGYIFGLSTNMRLTEIGRPWSEDVATRERYQNRKKSGASFRPAMPQPAGASPARSSPASKPASKAATYASSSPICQAGQKCSTKRCIARAGAWRISSRT